MADLTITAASVIAGAGAQKETGLAGTAITAGQVVYKDSATGKYDLADSDSATAEIRIPAGIALNGAALNQPLAVAKSGPVTIGATMIAGTAYYLSDEPGGICPFADLETGDFVVFLGLATSTTVLNLNILSAGVAL